MHLPFAATQRSLIRRAFNGATGGVPFSRASFKAACSAFFLSLKALSSSSSSFLSFLGAYRWNPMDKIRAGTKTPMIFQWPSVASVFLQLCRTWRFNGACQTESHGKLYESRVRHLFIFLLRFSDSPSILDTTINTGIRVDHFLEDFTVNFWVLCIPYIRMIEYSASKLWTWHLCLFSI